MINENAAKNRLISGLTKQEVGECAKEIFQAASTPSGAGFDITPDIFDSYCRARLTMHAEQALNSVGIKT